MVRHKPVTSKLILKQLENTLEQRRETTELEADKTLEQDTTIELQDEVLAR